MTILVLRKQNVSLKSSSITSNYSWYNISMTQKSSSIITVSHLVKKYADFTAVDDISFEVKEGEIFGILGPNGTVLIDGVDTKENPWEVKRRIGVQLQSSNFYPELTLVELLQMFAAMYDVPVKPLEMLKKVQLEDKAKSYVNKLSGGQKQRFSIATTLINKPRVIFLDEPTTGLDPQARLNLWEMIQEVRKEGVTLVLTTHYMDEAQELCDRLAIMDSGKIITIGSPRELIDKLLKTGFKKEVKPQPATLEDVFLHMTGKALRDE
jgi:ABC-2 type transport system ATP-binding protein